MRGGRGWGGGLVVYGLWGAEIYMAVKRGSGESGALVMGMLGALRGGIKVG